MNLTPIEWTTFSANPLKYRDASGEKVWGCVHHSPGCINCYSETLAKRYGRGGPFNVQTMRGLTPFLDDAELHQMLTAKVIKGVQVSGSKCFVGDMTDIFGEWVPDELLDRLLAVFALRADVTWQVLTKRAERMHRYFDTRVTRHIIAAAAKDLPRGKADGWQGKCDNSVCNGPWPLPNVWLGVSCEDQKRADERIPLLLQTPAAVRFVSAEPLLGPIDMKRWLKRGSQCECGIERGTRDGCQPSIGMIRCNAGLVRLSMVIAGGESGNGARPHEVAWSESLLKQCAAAGVAGFMKQMGSTALVPAGRLRHHEWGEGKFEHWQSDRPGLWRVKLRDKKGGDMSEWPEWLRVRQFPVTQREAAPR